MNLKINLENKRNNLKFLFFIFIYMIFFYFFIFENLNLFFELKEEIRKSHLELQKLSYQKTEFINSIQKKREIFKNLTEEMKKIQSLEKKKKNFSNVSNFFEYINMYIDKNNIFLENFGRIIKDDNSISVNITAYGDEKNIFNFLSDLEKSDYLFKLSESYFRIERFKGFIKIRFSISTKINENFKKIKVENKKVKDIFLKEKNKSLSFIKIGNKIIYKEYEKIKSEQKENKKSKNITDNNKKSEEGVWKR